jgi:hypothetical protein
VSRSRENALKLTQMQHRSLITRPGEIDSASGRGRFVDVPASVPDDIRLSREKIRDI